MEGIRGRYEEFHHVSYSDAAIRACITLAQRYISDRCLPDKAIDVLDEAGSRAHLSVGEVPEEIVRMEGDIEPVRVKKREAALRGDFREAAELHAEEKEKMRELQNAAESMRTSGEMETVTVNEDDVARAVSVITGIPVHKIARDESLRLMNMEKALQSVIIGQDEAISRVVKAIRRNRAGIKDPGKPIGTFLFLGPTGVGKTHLAKKIAEYMFDSADNIIRIDMSEYGEKFAVSRMIGAPPGYVGYQEGGQLSEQVRRKPYSVVLLDEIEKAHPDIFNVLLQVLDEGRLTDGSGRTVDFKNTILIMTSNIGSRELKDFGGGMGFTTSASDTSRSRKSIIDKAISKAFSPEFINRLDEQVYFNSLTQDDICKIIDIELGALSRRLEEMGCTLTIDKAAKKFIAEVGYDPKYGARPLKRAIQKYVEDPVSEAIIEGTGFAAEGIAGCAPMRSMRIALNSGKNGTVVKRPRS
jgi:ATPases with chaperone activity, ATP-binding subunit